MSLIVEDGNNVADANSYVDIDYARAYASGRSLILPDDDTALSGLLVRGYDYIESKRDRYKGFPTYTYGGSQWPRIGVHIDGFEIGEKQIPREVRQAQVKFAAIVHSDPTATEGEARVKKEKVGPLETEYFDDGPATLSTLEPVDDLLAPLFGAGAFSLRTIRA